MGDMIIVWLLAENIINQRANNIRYDENRLSGITVKHVLMGINDIAVFCRYKGIFRIISDSKRPIVSSN